MPIFAAHFMNTIEQIRKWCNGTWLAKADNNAGIDTLAIDSRNIEHPASSLFIALKTSLRDGHSYIPEAWQKGVRNFLVSNDMDTTGISGANFIQVKDTLTALQQIAANHRKQFKIPVIGITGSNGKTMIKEWLYQLLSGQYNIVRSPKSYNSQIGVPLSVWQMEAEHELGIFEAGISQPGEMEKLEKMILPSLGIFTNIGEAHSEGFMNNRQKINEKLMLFRHTAQLVYCLDHSELNQCIIQFMHQVRSANTENPLQLFTWSQKQDADLRITDIDKSGIKTTISARYKGKETSITIPFTDDASVENAIHCWCLMLLLGISSKEIKAQMLLLQPVSMRLELRHGINDCTVINDSYNSDLTSLQHALNYLDQQKQHGQHTVIMSDILEIGRRDLDLYDEVAALVSKRTISRFIGIGPALYKNKASFRKHKKLRSIFFKSTEDFLKNFHLLTFNKEAILLKGARVFAFEKIGMLLEQKVHQTVMSIDLSALTHNLNVFRAELSPGVKTMAMVKAFAYGSGSYEIANLLQYAGVDYLSVAYTDEGITLRKAGIKMPIMVMSPDASSFDRMIAWRLEPEIFNFRSLTEFMDIAQTLEVKKYPVHIKLDTGMHRLGFNPGDMEQLAKQVKESTGIHVASIFSHLAASDDPNEDAFTNGQGELFKQMSQTLIDALGYKPMLHLCNSAGIIRHHHLHFDMVRLGLGLYGVDSSNVLQSKLKQISTLKTNIAQVRTIPAGDNIGYGHHTIAPTDMRIATICIGYADGYPRSLGKGNAYVLIHGKQAKTLGSICMDMCMVDITHIPEAQEGDEVIVFGKELPVTQLAAWANTISYEIMTSISQRVKRIYVNEE
ncbi:MAG: alanine racemase [Flavipsychrobacter sp.]|jgi:alanine racemase|nr:alanine racemase [Flavipsychrobacter sp.]